MERLVLDACAVINLWAAGIIQELVDDCGLELLVAETVAGEAMYVEGDEPGDERESIEWQQLRSRGTIRVLTLSGERELTAFLAYIPRLGDGEAASLAIARERTIVLATDDALALRTAAEHNPPIDTVTTPDIVSWWAYAAEADAARIAEAISHIERRARFRPTEAHPLAGWWRSSRDAR